MFEPDKDESEVLEERMVRAILNHFWQVLMNNRLDEAEGWALIWSLLLHFKIMTGMPAGEFVSQVIRATVSAIDDEDRESVRLLLKEMEDV